MDSPVTATAKPSVFRSVLDAAVFALELFIIAAACAGLAATALVFPTANPAGTPVWPPSGLALALVLLRGYRIWPAILAGYFCAGVLLGQSFPDSAVLAAGVLAAALAGAWLARRWSDGRKTFATPRRVLRFSLICLAPTALIASLAALAATAASGDVASAEVAAIWTRWWLADAAGSLMLASVVVLWAVTPVLPVSRRHLETLVLLASVAVIGLAAYGPFLDGEFGALAPHRSVLGFLVIAPLMWAALRARPRDAVTAALLYCGIAAWGLSEGAAFDAADLNGSLLLLFMLSIGTTVPPLVLSATIAMRGNEEARLLSDQRQLRRRIEETDDALHSARRHFQILIEGVVDYAIFVVDAAGRVASWNSGAQKIIGYSADEIIGKHFGIFYRPDERRAGEPNRALELAIQHGKYETEGWRLKKNGALFFVTGSISSMRNDEGKLVGFYNVIRDTTERRDAQEKLVQAREQLAMAQKMEAIGKLTGGIAHDFNNLLMIIGGNAQTFKRLLDPKLPLAIEAIQTAAKRGESLTRQLLTFSRRQHLSPTVVDLNTSIRNMRTMIESSLRGNIVYEDRIEQDVLPVKVDLAELELAIVNIAVNARDAMPNGGTFTLSVRGVPAHDLLPGDGPGDSFAAIELRDTGMGMPPNLLSKIFDPFFTTKEVGKGTGLGLSQVYGFAHQAGGTVRAESKVGHGTVFTLYLPLCSEKPTATKDSSSIDLAYAQRPTVLVVDDSAEVAQVTSSLFEHLGYNTVYRDSAEAALKVLAGGARFDLVFSDIVMPGAIDGVGLAREIRTRFPDLPVILTTGYSDAAQAAPADLPILRKPFDSDALRGFIHDAVEAGAAL